MCIDNYRRIIFTVKQSIIVWYLKLILRTDDFFTVTKSIQLNCSSNHHIVFWKIVWTVIDYSSAWACLAIVKLWTRFGCYLRINRNRKCSANCMNESVVGGQLDLKIWAFLLYNLNLHLSACTALCIVHIRCWNCIYFLSVLIWKRDCFITLLLCCKVRNFIIQCKFILSLCTFENYVFFNAGCSNKILQVNIAENILIQSFCCYIFKRSKFIITACFFVIFLYISLALACIIVAPADFISVWLQWNHIFWLCFIWKIDRNITAFVCVWRIARFVWRCSLILR